MKAINALLSRTSSSALEAPAPIVEQREIIFQAGLRASDHGRLRPWRFLIIEGSARERLGDVFAESYKRKNPGCTPEKLEKIAAKAISAPLIVVVISRVNEEAKIPAIEQMLSAGAAAQLMLLAAHAQGFAGVWKTGEMAYDKFVHEQLGMTSREKIVGFLYFGTAIALDKPPPVISSADYFVSWV